MGGWIITTPTFICSKNLLSSCHFAVFIKVIEVIEVIKFIKYKAIYLINIFFRDIDIVMTFI